MKNVITNKQTNFLSEDLIDKKMPSEFTAFLNGVDLNDGVRVEGTSKEWSDAEIDIKLEIIIHQYVVESVDVALAQLKEYLEKSEYELFYLRYFKSYTLEMLTSQRVFEDKGSIAEKLLNYAELFKEIMEETNGIHKI